MSFFATIHHKRSREMTTAYHFSFFSIAILLLFTLFNMKHQFFVIAAVEVMIATCWIFMIVLHHKQRIPDAVVSHGVILWGFIVFDTLLLRGGYGNAGIFWMLGFPFLAYFFAGKKLGSYWCSAYIFTFFAIQYAASQQWITLTYGAETLDLIPATLFVFSVLAYFYEKNREEAIHREHQARQSLQKEVIQHHQDEQALLLSQTRIKAMMADMREAVFKLNLEERVTFISPSIQQISHFEQHQVINMTLNDLFTKHQDTLKFHQAIHHYGQVRNFEVELQSGNQQRVFVSINARLTYHEENKVSGIEGIISDVTQVTQSASSMRLLIHELRKSRDLALAASQTKTNFLALISHELRTPIHGLMGIQEMLIADMQTLSQEQQNYLKASQQATLTISNLIYDIICVSDINSAPQQQESIQLPSFFSAIIHHHRYLLQDKKLDCKLHLWDVPQSIKVNTSALRQIVLNLLAYAIKLAYSGTVSIHVRENQSQLIIKMDYSGEAFNPDITHSDATSMQLDLPTQQHLEVALVQHFLSILNASMHIQSQEFEHTVTLQAPIVVTNEERIQSHLDALQCQPNQPATTTDDAQVEASKPWSILLAEDDKISRIVAVKRLKRAGFHVVAVQDGLEAWHQLQHTDFDILLTDIRMPKLDGASLIKKVREHELNTQHRTYILGLSAHVMQTHIDEYFALGMDYFLSKPIQPSQIISYIHQVKTGEPIPLCTP